MWVKHNMCGRTLVGLHASIKGKTQPVQSDWEQQYFVALRWRHLDIWKYISATGLGHPRVLVDEAFHEFNGDQRGTVLTWRRT